MKKVALSALLLFWCVAALAATGIREEVLAIRTQLKSAQTAMQQGLSEDAAERSAGAFQDFEESQFHKQIAAKDVALYRALESDWLRLTQSYEAKNALQASQYFASLEHQLQKGVQLLDLPVSSSAVALNAFVILFREGFEALLILGAVLATLRKINRPELSRVIWSGASVGVAASLGLYGASLHFIKLQGAGREILEGATMLVAAVVLFYLSYWLISKVRGRQWQEFIQSKVQQALSKRSIMALGALAFLVVFREGFETVLMLRALEAGTTGWAPIAQGIGLAVIALAVVFVAVMVLGLKLPIRTFFSVTSVFLLFLVFKFAGDGIMELQEGGAISFHLLSWMPTWGWFKSFFGVHGSVEGLLVQSLVFAAIIMGLAITLSRSSSKTALAEPTQEFRDGTVAKLI